MPRPTNKAELVTAAENGYAKLNELIDSIPAAALEATFPFEDRDRNVRDVVMHLVAWHKMMQRWYTEGMADQKPAIPAEGYTWKTYPALNQAIWAEAQQTSLAQARADFAQTHKETLTLITAHSDEELFTKKHYNWTGTTSLGAYFISATSSHYDWAMKKIKKAIKAW